MKIFTEGGLRVAAGPHTGQRNFEAKGEKKGWLDRFSVICLRASEHPLIPGKKQIMGYFSEKTCFNNHSYDR